MKYLCELCNERIEHPGLCDLCHEEVAGYQRGYFPGCELGQSFASWPFEDEDEVERRLEALEKEVEKM